MSCAPASTCTFTPDRSNPDSVTVGNHHYVLGYCNFPLPGDFIGASPNFPDDSVYQAVCESLSPTVHNGSIFGSYRDPEWVHDSAGSIISTQSISDPDYWNQNTCTISSCHRPNESKSDCDTSSFSSDNGLKGRRPRCRRVGYSGFPQPCCFKDVRGCEIGSLHETTPSTNGGVAVCNPNLANLGGETCGNSIDMTEYCYGFAAPKYISLSLPGSGNSLRRFENAWLSGDCVKFITRQIIKTPSGNEFCSWQNYRVDGSNKPVTTNFSAAGFTRARKIMTRVLKEFMKLFGGIRNPGDKYYTPLQQKLFDVCYNYPGLCSEGLRTICSSETPDTLKRNPALAKWCGCYMPDGQYSRYTSKFGVPIECTPVCTQPTTIKKVQANLRDIQNCGRNVCVIDDVNIDLYNSTIAGDIELKQLCGGCSGSSSCGCFIDDVNISLVNSKLEGGINIGQTCGSQKCYKTGGSDGLQKIEVPCGSNTDPFASNTDDNSVSVVREKRISTQSLILVGVVFVLLIIILYFLLRPKKIKVVRPVIRRR